MPLAVLTMQAGNHAEVAHIYGNANRLTKITQGSSVDKDCRRVSDLRNREVFAATTSAQIS